MFGWTPANEIGNGRWVMFGFIVGMMTELATGVDFIHQLEQIVTYTGEWPCNELLCWCCYPGRAAAANCTWARMVLFVHAWLVLPMWFLTAPCLPAHCALTGLWDFE